MCIAELRERLALLKEKEREREEQKRREISDGKVRQGQRLDEAKRKIQGNIHLYNTMWPFKPNDNIQHIDRIYNRQRKKIAGIILSLLP